MIGSYNAVRFRGKLSQNNLNLFRRLFSSSQKLFTPQTLVEKIVTNYTVGLPPNYKVKSGDYVMIKPQHIMTWVIVIISYLLSIYLDCL